MTIPSLTEADLLTDQIDAILPQTQCRQCTYPGCRLYAEAIVSGEADIDQCPPGGEAGVAKLAALLGRAVQPLNPVHGTPKPRAVAWIDEAVCIGCALCIKACPVDAIVGAAKLMHTVISAECTGCELCIAPCPVDCIAMRPIESNIGTWSETPRADRARGRYEFRLMRLARDEADKELAAHSSATDARQATVAAAIERAKMKRAGAAIQQETANAASQPADNQSADPDRVAQ